MKTIRKIFLFLAIFAIGTLNSTNSFYNDELAFSDEGKTIMELKENINELDKEDVNIESEYKELNADYQIKSFLKKDLTLLELNRIRNLVKEYNTNNSTIELVLFEKAKNGLSVVDERRKLLEEKRKLYSGLIPYIDPEFDAEYIEYIKGDAKLFNEKEDVKEDKIIKQEILNHKVDLIETKIQEHRDFINQSIQKIIETRLDEKIDNLSNNETFKVLSIESKIKVLDKTIEKIKIKLQNLENTKLTILTGSLSNTETTVIDKKIQTYKIAVFKLEEFRNSLQ